MPAEQGSFPFPHVDPVPRPLCGAPGPRGFTCSREPHADHNHRPTGKPPTACEHCGAPAGEDCIDPNECIARWQWARIAQEKTP
jgi:hypothetical protein